MAVKAKPAVPRGTKLSLGFGLMSVPVQVKLLHETQKPVPGRIVCPEHGDTLSRQTLCCEGTPEEHVLNSGETVTAYPHPDDSSRLVPVDPDVLKALEEQKTGVAAIEAIVDVLELDPVYVGQTFLVWPQPEGEQQFDLLCEALRSENKAAVVSVVLRKQTQMIAFRWSAELGCMVGHGVRYATEIRHGDVELVRQSAKAREAEVNPQMLELAKQLLATLGGEEFDAGEIEDRWTPVLQEAIRQADSGKAFVAPVEAGAAAPVVDLMAALQASVDAAKPKKAAPRRKKVAA